MEITTINENGVNIAVINSEECLICDTQSALDLMMTVHYDTGCNRIAINKEAVTDEFFVLSTRIAGDILQKYTNYHVKLAIYGDFTGYTSKPLKDFMYESNRGNDIYFQPTLELALERLAYGRDSQSTRHDFEAHN